MDNELILSVFFNLYAVMKWRKIVNIKSNNDNKSCEYCTYTAWSITKVIIPVTYKSNNVS